MDPELPLVTLDPLDRDPSCRPSVRRGRRPSPPGSTQVRSEYLNAIVVSVGDVDGSGRVDGDASGELNEIAVSEASQM